MSELVGRTIQELTQLLTSKKVSAVEIAGAHLAHAKAIESDLQAYNTITDELALSQARKVDELIARQESLPALAGIPVAVKDNICIADYPTTCSSKILENFIAPYTAGAAQRLLEAGALVIGKTNMDEFAMGSSTENSAFKKTRNPWDTHRVPGGSSGGSTVAVASGSAVVALGSDTGGSVRQPASFCGVVGMKPTYGMISRFGLVAYASSLDQIGPLGRTVEDTARLLACVGAHDQRDSTSYDKGLPDVLSGLRNGVRGMKMAVISELIAEGIDADVQKSIREAIAVLKELGATVDEVSMPYLKHALPVYYLIATAEASSNLARFDGVRYGHRDKDAGDLLDMYLRSRSQGFGAEVKRRIMLGTYALSSGYYDAYYKKAQQVRRLIKNEFDQKFADYQILISPTSPSVAFELGAKVDDPLTMYLSDIATIPVNLAGLPAISVPCGFGAGDLPIGLQLLAQPLGDAVALQAAYAFEQATDHHRRRPAAATASR